jgi:hypothetical protein
MSPGSSLARNRWRMRRPCISSRGTQPCSKQCSQVHITNGCLSAQRLLPRSLPHLFGECVILIVIADPRHRQLNPGGYIESSTLRVHIPQFAPADFALFLNVMALVPEDPRKVHFVDYPFTSVSLTHVIQRVCRRPSKAPPDHGHYASLRSDVLFLVLEGMVPELVVGTH